MVKIKLIEILSNRRIKLHFDDGVVKVVNMDPFIGEDEITRKLQENDYFKKLNIYENGRGIYWPNGFDFCPDYLHDYVDAEMEITGK